MKAVKTTVAKAQQTVERAKAAAPAGPMGPQKPTAKDTFERAARAVVALTVPTVTVSPKGMQIDQGPVRIDLKPAKEGGSVEIAGERYGAHFRPQDRAATLGAVSFEAGGHEVSVGVVPAAPAPLPMPVYVGPTRDD